MDHPKDGVLVDTNVLVRRAEPGHQLHRLATDCVALLIEDGEAVFVTPQNVAELWNAMTRPVASNGLGLSVALAAAEIAKIERVFYVLPDTPAAYEIWKRLVVEHEVKGSKVHDARLVALMRVHGVNRILTFDAGDFARYGVEVLNPARVP